jgi:hypothetical protein
MAIAVRSTKHCHLEMEPSRLRKYSDHILVCSVCLDILSSCLHRYFSPSAFNGTAVPIDIISTLYAAKTKNKKLAENILCARQGRTIREPG